MDFLALLYESQSATKPSLMAMVRACSLPAISPRMVLPLSTVYSGRRKAPIKHTMERGRALKIALKASKSFEVTRTSFGVMLSEGVLGLQRSMLAAGAKKLIASYWPVASDETVTLMSDMYESFVSGNDIASSLRKSKIKMIQQNLSPYYWGAFTCISSNIQ